MPPIALTDSQMSAVLAASHPIAPDLRGAFLADVAQELSGLGTLGDGVCHRVVATVQKKYFDPPVSDDNSRRHGIGKYA